MLNEISVALLESDVNVMLVAKLKKNIKSVSTSHEQCMKAFKHSMLIHRFQIRD